jgi:hypothetical protein
VERKVCEFKGPLRIQLDTCHGKGRSPAAAESLSKTPTFVAGSFDGSAAGGQTIGYDGGVEPLSRSSSLSQND